MKLHISNVPNQNLSFISSETKFRWKNRTLPTEMNIGSFCHSSIQCSLFIPNSQCEIGNEKCNCKSYHVPLNLSSCLPASLLGYACSSNSQCTLKVPNSHCLNGLCQCKSNFIPYKHDKCLHRKFSLLNWIFSDFHFILAAKLGGYCLSDQQCQMGDKNSKCWFIIPRIYGKCGCLEGFTEGTDGKCYPGLGKHCEHDGDCLKETINSFCKLPTLTSVNRSPECRCKEGFVERTNKCERDPKPILGKVFNLEYIWTF